MSHEYVVSKTLRCPHCGSAHVRPSRRGFGLLLGLCLLRRWRCMSCSKPFNAYLWEQAERHLSGRG